MIYDSLVSLIGTPPTGTEPVIYVTAAIVALFIIDSVSSFIISMFMKK